MHPAPAKPAPAVLQQTSAHGGHSRPSLVPNPRAAPSKVPRVSVFGAGGSGFQSFAIGGFDGGKRPSIAGGPSNSVGLTDKEIDERVIHCKSCFLLILNADCHFNFRQIAKAVEMEVTRRLEEREKERLREEEERRTHEMEQQISNSEKAIPSTDQIAQQSLPSGVLTPLLKRHRDLDDELKARLHELEEKL